MITWELIYGMGQKFKVFATKPHMTKTHFAELFNNLVYGIATARALVEFSKPTEMLNTQEETFAQNTQNSTNQDVKPIYTDINYNVENSDVYQM